MASQGLSASACVSATRVHFDLDAVSCLRSFDLTVQSNVHIESTANYVSYFVSSL